jgi:hypothetical protein
MDIHGRARIGSGKPLQSQSSSNPDLLLEVIAEIFFGMRGQAGCPEFSVNLPKTN